MPASRAFSSEPRSWLIYGAYGFTGALIVEEAVRRGYRPILAGRHHERLKELAGRYGLDAVQLSLDDKGATRGAVANVSLVLNAAGPFGETGPKIIEACLDAGVHYVDVAGELHHLRYVEKLDARARHAGVALLTGAGFGVTYGECLACRAVELLPDATHLRLSVAAANAQTTPAVRRSIIEVLAEGGYSIDDGRIRRRALAHQRWKIHNGHSMVSFGAAPLGELAALYRTTRVNNITVGLPMTWAAAWTMRLLSPLIHFGLGIRAVRRIAGSERRRAVTSAPEPAGGWSSRIWVEAANADGKQLCLRLELGEGYRATAHAVMANVEALLSESLAGAFTPGLAFGSRLLEALPNASVTECRSRR